MKKSTRDVTRQDSDIRQETTVGELVIRYPELRLSLEKMGIDYCCGGKRPLGEVASQAGLKWPVVLAALKAALAPAQERSERTDWNKVSISLLVDHILDKHHVFTKEQLPRLDELLARVEKAHAIHHGKMLRQLRRVYGPLRAELEAHLAKEEQVLFPAIKGIDAFMSGKGTRPVVHCGSIANPIRQMEHEHESAGHALAEMRQITDGYRLPADACQTFTALYDGMRAIEDDLHEHIHLENNILYPKSVEMEDAMLKKDA